MSIKRATTNYARILHRLHFFAPVAPDSHQTNLYPPSPDAVVPTLVADLRNFVYPPRTSHLSVISWYFLIFSDFIRKSLNIKKIQRNGSFSADRQNLLALRLEWVRQHLAKAGIDLLGVNQVLRVQKSANGVKFGYNSWSHV